VRHTTVGLRWTKDRPVAETSTWQQTTLQTSTWQHTTLQTSTWQHTTLTRDTHPCPRKDWNPQSQQGNGRRPTS